MTAMTGNANQSASEKFNTIFKYLTNMTNSDLPFSCAIRGPPESPWHVAPMGCPVTLPYAHTWYLLKIHNIVDPIEL